MSENKKSVWKTYLICTIIAVGIVVFALSARDFAMKNAKEWMQALHNGFFAAGALLMLFYGLLYVSSEGAFLGVGYIMRRAIQVVIPPMKRDHETYRQYRERKLSKPHQKGDGAIFFVGLIFFAISLIFLFIWYQL